MSSIRTCSVLLAVLLCGACPVSAVQQPAPADRSQELSAADFFKTHCAQPNVAEKFVSSSWDELERGVLIEYGGVRWCAVVLPPLHSFSPKDELEDGLDRSRHAVMRASYLLIKSLKRDVRKSSSGSVRWDNDTFERLILTASGPVAEGAAALVWRRVDDLR